MLLGSSIVFQPMGKSVRFDLMLKLSLCLSENHAENHRSGEMAALRDSESEEGMFLGFTKEDQQSIAELRQGGIVDRHESDSESDISVSSVATEDLSDFTDSEGEEIEETWNVNEDPIEVLPFSVATGPTSGVAENGTAKKFFTYLMFQNTL